MIKYSQSLSSSQFENEFDQLNIDFENLLSNNVIKIFNIFKNFYIIYINYKI